MIAVPASRTMSVWFSSPEVGVLWSPARVNASRRLGAIHFANTDLSAVALCEEALDHDVRAAEEVLAGLAMNAPTWRYGVR
jgi:hypothetical protein